MGHTVRSTFHGVESSFVAAGVLLCAALSPRPARAATSGASTDAGGGALAPTQRFGSGSQWVIGVEGVLTLTEMPEHEVSSFPDEEGHRTTTSVEAMSLVGFSPRLGVDAFVTDHLSVGMGATYAQSGSRYVTRSSAGTNEQQDSFLTLGVRPRIGLAYSFRSGWGVWGRAGVELGSMSQWSNYAGGSQSHASYGFAATLDLSGTYSPQKDVVITAGPTLKVPVTAWGDDTAVIPPSHTPILGFGIGAGLVL